jgi:hypothetical protein
MSVRITKADAARLGIVTPKGSKGTPQAGLMNATESRFSDKLWLLKHDGAVLDYLFEAEKFRLATNTFLTVDFRVTLPSYQNIFIEVKGGFIREDAIAKLKFVAEQHPYAFYLAQWKDGDWNIRRMPSRRWRSIECSLMW